MEIFAFFVGRTLLGAICCLTWIRIITRAQSFRHLQDVPNERSSHVKSIPRGAGLAFPVTLFLGLLLSDHGLAKWIDYAWVLTALGISILGFVDDILNIRAAVRLFFQFGIAIPYLYFITAAMDHQPLIELAVVMLFAMVIVSSINFFNFADGINGYVALQFGLFLFSLFWYGGESTRLRLLEFSSPLIGGLIVFLWENMKRKSVFMGDSGSTCLGFLAATLPAQMTESHLAEFQAIGGVLVVVGIFGFVIFTDILTALAAKAIYQVPLTQPHREHFYQRLSRKEKMGHSKTALLLFGIQLAISLLFLLSLNLNESQARWSLIGLGLFCAAYTVIVLTTNFRAIRSYSLLART